MQIEKSQPEGTRIKPEARFTEFPALSVDPRVGISRSASETDDYFFFAYCNLKTSVLYIFFYN